MPQFDLLTFPTQLIWLVITFVVLYVLMSRIALPRIGEVLDERQKRIDDNLDKAEVLKAEADIEATAYANVQAVAREQARTIIYETTQQAGAESARRQEELGERLGAQIKEAEENIAAAKSAAMAEVSSAAVEVATQTVERLIGVTPAAGSVSTAVESAMSGGKQ
jgi:F-type H+-transporting ATPase subunit b